MAVLRFSSVVNHPLVRSEGRRSNPGFAQMFFSTKVNGETYCREWLVYSPAERRVFCFVCKLFPSNASCSALDSHGFDGWHNSYLIQTHENSEKHRNAM